MEVTYDDYLAHYGVKGMKWGVRRSKQEALRRVRANAKSGKITKEQAKARRSEIKSNAKKTIARETKRINSMSQRQKAAEKRQYTEEFRKANKALLSKSDSRNDYAKTFAKTAALLPVVNKTGPVGMLGANLYELQRSAGYSRGKAFINSALIVPGVVNVRNHAKSQTTVGKRKYKL